MKDLMDSILDYDQRRKSSIKLKKDRVSEYQTFLDRLSTFKGYQDSETPQ